MALTSKNGGTPPVRDVTAERKKHKLVQFNTLIKEDIYKRFKATVYDEGRTMYDVVTDMVLSYLRDNGAIKGLEKYENISGRKRLR